MNKLINFTRIISFIMAAVIIAMFAGCNNQNSPSEGSDSSDVPSTKLFDSPITFTLLFSEHANQPVKTDTLKFKTITELTNVTLDVDVTPASAYNNKINAAAASGKMYDITFMMVEQMRQYSPALYLDLTDMYETYAPDYYALIKDDKENEVTAINGRYYGFTPMNDVRSSETGEYGGIWPVIRTDILDENGLSIPSTWDEFFDVMKKLKRIYPDSTPLSGRSKYTIIDTLEHSLGMFRNVHRDTETGKYVCGVLEDEYFTVLKTMNRYYSEGILDNEFESVDTSTWNDGVNTGKIFAWIDNIGFASPQTIRLQAVNPKAKMQMIPLMTNSFGKKRGIIFTDNQYTQQYVISAKTAEPEKVVQFMNWTYTREGMLTTNYGKENVSYTVKEDGSVDVPDSIVAQYKGTSAPDYSWMSDYGLGQLCFAPLFNQKYTVASKLADQSDREEFVRSMNIFKADVEAGNTIYHQTLLPNIDTEMAEKAELISSYINQTVFQFVKGTKPLSEYNSFVDQVKSMGIKDLLDAYNS